MRRLIKSIFCDSFLRNLNFSPLAPSALARRLCTLLEGGAPKKVVFEWVIFVKFVFCVYVNVALMNIHCISFEASNCVHFYESFLKNLNFSPLAPSALARRLCTLSVGIAPKKVVFE